MKNASQKNEIRKIILQKRMLLEKAEVLKLSLQICKNVADNFVLAGKSVGIYMPFRNEADVLHLLDLAQFKPSLPLILNNEMHFKKWDKGGELVQNKIGIYQPPAGNLEVTPDVILTPMLAFDERCYRIGYGGGFYDKFFANYNGLKIGLAFEMQKVPSVPSESFDVKLDFIVTELNCYSL